jgi:hypothetical protein
MVHEVFTSAMQKYGATFGNHSPNRLPHHDGFIHSRNAHASCPNELRHHEGSHVECHAHALCPNRLRHDAGRLTYMERHARYAWKSHDAILAMSANRLQYHEGFLHSRHTHAPCANRLRHHEGFPHRTSHPCITSESVSVYHKGT